MVLRSSQRFRRLSPHRRIELRRRLARRHARRLRSPRRVRRLHLRRCVEQGPTSRLWRDADRWHVRLRRHVGGEHAPGFRARSAARWRRIHGRVARGSTRRASGILRMPNGAFHDGHWEHNSPVGEGTRVSAEGIEFVGAWDGDFVAERSRRAARRPALRRQALRLEAQDRSIRRSWPGSSASPKQGNLDAALLLGQAYRFFLSPAPDRDTAIHWYDARGRRRARRSAIPARRDPVRRIRDAAARSGTADRRGRTGSRRREHPARRVLSARHVRRERSRARATFLRSRNRPGRSHRAQQSGVAARDQSEREAARRQSRGNARATACGAVRQLGLSRHARRRASRSGRLRGGIENREEGAWRRRNPTRARKRCTICNTD